MDLAEIRKKARLQNASEKTDVQEGSLQPAIVETEQVTPQEILENFWGSDAGLAITTEEDYAKNLLSHELEREENVVQWLTFFLGKEEYALELSAVLELIRPRHLTDLPQVPEYLLGIVSLRGVIVPVVDLGRRLNLEQCRDASQQRVIVCSFEDQRIGLLVDRVAQVVRMNRDHVEAPPLIPDAPDRDFVAGIGRIKDRMLILLDQGKVMDIERQESV